MLIIWVFKIMDLYFGKYCNWQYGHVKIMRNKKSKLLFVGAFPFANRLIVGGMVTSCRALIQSSLASRIDLDLLDSTQISNPPPNLLLRSLFAIRRFWIFIWRFEFGKPDAILLFVSSGASVIEKGLMSWYARWRGCPALIFPRGGGLIKNCVDSKFQRILTKAVFGGASAVLCQGSTWQQFSINVLGFSVNKSPIVPNWTASEALLKIGDERTNSSSIEGIRFLFVGWLDEKKGIMDLLVACKQLAVSNNFRLDLVGEGDVSKIARDFVQNSILEDIVFFHGWLHGEPLLQRYRDADVFVLPSFAEGLPNSMIEAMAAKLPVVVSAVGNIPDVIKNGVTGLLVEPNNVSELTKALSIVLENRSKMSALAMAGQEKARAEFAVEPAVERLMKVIQDVTN
jgi:glycosyltransferase involved in cell wall biosynthesis